jgi:hypothetical protein
MMYERYCAHLWNFTPTNVSTGIGKCGGPVVVVVVGKVEVEKDDSGQQWSAARSEFRFKF